MISYTLVTQACTFAGVNVNIARPRIVMELRCSIEVLDIQGKLVFDRSIENLDCITHHEEYKAITNKALLQNDASGVTHNE